MKRNQLKAEDKKFFTLAAEIIFTNPFSDEWNVLKNNFFNEKPPKKRQPMHFMEAFFEPLNDRLTRLEKQGKVVLASYSEEDRQLLEYAFLFHIYRRYVPDIEKLIQSVSNPSTFRQYTRFAKSMLRELIERGFEEETAIRYIGIFYQFRRAFHFISRTLTGNSPSMKKLRWSLWNNVFTHDVRIYENHLWNRMDDFSTMLLGETGTGKGAAASAIGRSAYIPYDPKKGVFTHNFNDTFMAINLSQFPETLIESELFGHCKGAFTGAVADYTGLFERCSAQGSLFLDEIGDVSIPIQIKLLKVLEERIFSPVGGHFQKNFKGRVIAATHHSMETLRKRGDFRDDFFYRLCSDVIVLPTLRQRIQELPDELDQLVVSLITRITGNENEALADMVLQTLQNEIASDYPWPGNVRELEQAVRRVLLTKTYQGDWVRSAGTLEEELIDKIKSKSISANDLLGYYCTLIYNRFGTYEEVAKHTQLDRRTAKKYILEYQAVPQKK